MKKNHGKSNEFFLGTTEHEKMVNYGSFTGIDTKKLLGQ